MDDDVESGLRELKATNERKLDCSVDRDYRKQGAPHSQHRVLVPATTLFLESGSHPLPFSLFQGTLKPSLLGLKERRSKYSLT